MEAIIFLLLIFLAVLLAGLSLIVILLLKNKPKERERDDKAFLMLQQQLTDLRGAVDSKLSQSAQSMQNQLTESRKLTQESSRVVREVTERLTQLDETNKQVIGFASQLRSLEDILKNPKQRGLLGEYNLELLLQNILPPQHFQMQYKFKDGETVDAVIFVGDKIIPIDSKFSLENYNRIVKEKDPAKRQELEKSFSQDLKNRIDETAKYIRPEEQTMDFALMFIPAEAIYYDLSVNRMGSIKANTRDLLEYASREKHVQIVSPNTFHVFLQMILQGLRGFQIEKAAQEIRANVEKLGRHLASYDQYMQKLGSQLSTVCRSYNIAYKELGKIDKDVVKITEGERKIDPLQIEKPSVE